MAEPVEWRDGIPRSPRFDDIYRSLAGGMEQARTVFLAGCGLPQVWGGQRQWCVLETGFGLGLNFLATWNAWKADAQRPGLLHFVSVEAHPVDAQDLLRNAEAYPELLPLVQALCAQWHGLEPGCHRLAFEGGALLLTLCVGDVKPMLRQLTCAVDSVFLDGFSPARNPDMWDAYTLKAVARCCHRGTRVATWTVARAVRDHLTQCGFALRMVPGLPPKRQRLEGSFDPAWQPKGESRAQDGAWTGAPGRCLVIGAGLAGASVAASLARRGWQVTVLDAGDAPAAGASGLPAGLVVPHVSSDDSVLSRMSRAGVRATWQQVHDLLREGQDFAMTGVRERQLDEGREGQDLWHARAGWIKPAQLIKAWLAQPGVTWQGQAPVQALRRVAEVWEVLDAEGRVLAQAPLVVVCAGFGSHALLRQALPLQALRGQLSWGWRRADGSDADAFPSTPVNGQGNFIPHVPTNRGQAWYLGSTFDRDDTDTTPRNADHLANLQRLKRLLPRTAQSLADDFGSQRVHAFSAVRCTAPDRLPVVGPVDPQGQPGLWVSTAMGARGLTLASLCAELLAAQLHREPLPVDQRLAQTLGRSRRSLVARTAALHAG